jgi:hypothetical protein
LGSTSGADFIGRDARNSDVVLSFEDNLNVAEFETVATTKLGQLASLGHEVVHKVIGNLEEYLANR